MQTASNVGSVAIELGDGPGYSSDGPGEGFEVPKEAAKSAAETNGSLQTYSKAYEMLLCAGEEQALVTGGKEVSIVVDSGESKSSGDETLAALRKLGLTVVDGEKTLETLRALRGGRGYVSLRPCLSPRARARDRIL